MLKLILSIFLSLLIFYFIPFAIYGSVSAFTGLKLPDDASPVQFLVSVLVIKIGIAIAFVLVFYFARVSLRDQWLLYALLWWLMFVFGEIGQALSPSYSWTEALLGIVSETLYVPFAAFLTNRLLRTL